MLRGPYALLHLSLAFVQDVPCDNCSELCTLIRQVDPARTTPEIRCPESIGEWIVVLTGLLCSAQLRGHDVELCVGHGSAAT